MILERNATVFVVYIDSEHLHFHWCVSIDLVCLTSGIPKFPVKYCKFYKFVLDDLRGLLINILFLVEISNIQHGKYCWFVSIKDKLHIRKHKQQNCWNKVFISVSALYRLEYLRLILVVIVAPCGGFYIWCEVRVSYRPVIQCERTFNIWTQRRGDSSNRNWVIRCAVYALNATVYTQTHTHTHVHNLVRLLTSSGSPTKLNAIPCMDNHKQQLYHVLQSTPPLYYCLLACPCQSVVTQT